MNPPQALDYPYVGKGPTWDHSLVLPSIIAAVDALDPEAKILDIGCGNGAMLSEIRKRGSWSLHGVESSESGAAIARSQGFDVDLKDATTDLISVLGEHVFDLIISVEVIEHVYDPRGFLRQARGLLRPGGTLLLTTPYHGYLKNLAVAALGKHDSHFNPLWDCGHIKFWSIKTLSTVLEEASFGKIRFYGAGRVPYLWKSMVLTATAE